jgi:hypothetical protein
MTDYRYIYHKLGTEQVIAEIPLFGTYMDLEINKGGRCDGSFSLDMTGYDNQTLIDATIPGDTGLVVERNGIPIWSGFTWSRVYQSQSKSIQMYHQSWENFPQYELNLDDLSYTGIEEISIFYDLWTRMQAVSGRNMNINVPPGPYPTITPKDLSVLASDYNYYGELISSLADADDGFDWTIDISKSGNQYVRTLRTGFPQIGSSDPNQLTFEYPGAILNYYATESMSGAGTNVFMLGAGSGSSMIVNESRQDLMVAQGFPRWDVTVNRKDVTDPNLLAGLSAQAGMNRKPPMLVIKPEFKSDHQPEFGSFGLGDAGILNIKDPRFPNGFQFNCRIAKWMLQPQSTTNVDYYNVIMVGDDQSG